MSSWLKLYLWHPLLGLNKQTSDPSTRRGGALEAFCTPVCTPHFSTPRLAEMPDFRMQPEGKSHRSTREPPAGKRRCLPGGRHVHKYPGRGGPPFHTHSLAAGCQGPEGKHSKTTQRTSSWSRPGAVKASTGNVQTWKAQHWFHKLIKWHQDA